MIPVYLFFLAIIFSSIQIACSKRKGPLNSMKVFLSYLVLFNVGIMGLLGFYAHTFLADATAEKIGWAIGSPFQFEVAVANLSYGVLGVLAFLFRRSFLVATVIGYSTFLVGAFVGHLIQYQLGDTAPYNIGVFVWFNDLFIPILLLMLLFTYFFEAFSKPKSQN